MTPNRSIPISEKPRLYWKSGLWWAVGLSPAGIIIQEQGLCVQEAYFNWATQHARATTYSAV